MRGLLAAIALGILLTPVAARTQSRSAVPRGTDGKPDLTGVWQGNSTQRGSWDEANGGTGVGGSGRDPAAPVILSSNDRPGGGGAPYQDGAAKKVIESFKNRGIDDPTAQCLPGGVPRSVLVGLFPQQFIQTPTQIIVLYEYMHTHRIISMNAKHPSDLLPSYMGDSVGRWEGDTLVVDVVGFNDKTWLSGVGTFHSEALHVTERYTRVDKDRIDYEVTMDDPKVLTRAWTLKNSLMLREGTRLQEYICAENNLDPARYDQLLKAGVKISR